jgi:potassium-dependent mechanosensitive channel
VIVMMSVAQRVGMCLVLGAVACGAWAAPLFKERLAASEKVLKAEKVEIAAVQHALEDVGQLKTDANACINDGMAEVTRLAHDLEQLGAAQPIETDYLKQQRKTLTADKDKAEAGVKECRYTLVRAVDMQLKLASRQEALLQEELFSRATDALELVQQNAQDPAVWWTTSIRFLREHSGWALYSSAQQVLSGFMVLIGVVLGWRLRQYWQHRVERDATAPSGAMQRLQHALLGVFAMQAPLAIPLAGISVQAFLLSQGAALPPVLPVLVGAGSLYFFALLVLQALLSPPPPAQGIVQLPDNARQPMTRWLRALAALLTVAVIAPYFLTAHQLPEVVYASARLLFVATWVVVLFALTWWVGRLPGLRSQGQGFRWGVYALLIAIAFAEMQGYRNVADHLMKGLVGTSVVVLIYSLLRLLIHDVLDMLDDGRFRWTRRVREILNVAENDRIPGSLALRVMLVLVSMAAAALGLLWVWGVSNTHLLNVWEFLTQGFKVFDIHVIPSRVLLGVFIFVLLLSFVSWMKGNAERTWIPATRLERGAQDALATMVGYLGVFFAAVTGLTFAGVDFAKLTFILGALSVGIGLGLQNVASNFVSGIIMLFERPVRAGDWVVVGKVEGYVRKISLRSTIIETFDMADVVVPNSEFTASAVINWTLRDPRGRITVPVNVLHGTDTEKVREALLHVADSHPSVMKGSEISNPSVSFKGFSDSAINLELRCIVRDITKRGEVTSDLNFAIDKALRKHGIYMSAAARDAAMRAMPD